MYGRGDVVDDVECGRCGRCVADCVLRGVGRGPRMGDRMKLKLKKRRRNDRYGQIGGCGHVRGRTEDGG